MSFAPELVQVARRVVWFKEPETTLADTDFFLAHVMTYGTIDDVLIARKYYTRDQFCSVLDKAPPGVFDPRSWAYWNTVFGRIPTPEMPRRRLR